MTANMAPEQGAPYEVVRYELDGHQVIEFIVADTQFSVLETVEPINEHGERESVLTPIIHPEEVPNTTLVDMIRFAIISAEKDWKAKFNDNRKAIAHVFKYRSRPGSYGLVCDWREMRPQVEFITNQDAYRRRKEWQRFVNAPGIFV